jgi:hypothetical protein
VLPRIWGRLHGSLLVCLRKDVALVSHCVPGLGRGTEGLGDKPFWETAHFMCTVLLLVMQVGIQVGIVHDLLRVSSDVLNILFWLANRNNYQHIVEKMGRTGSI